MVRSMCISSKRIQEQYPVWLKRNEDCSIRSPVIDHLVSTSHLMRMDCALKVIDKVSGKLPKTVGFHLSFLKLESYIWENKKIVWNRTCTTLSSTMVFNSRNFSPLLFLHNHLLHHYILHFIPFIPNWYVSVSIILPITFHLRYKILSYHTKPSLFNYNCSTIFMMNI